MATSPPDYDAYQSSFHQAFRPQLHAILDGLPVPKPPAQVLDVPCGNGFYSRRLAERLPAGDRLVAADASADYLAQAREAVAGVSAATVEVLEADAYRLPFPTATFDLVWCAQSLITLDAVAAVREMFRVVKPDGLVAILEVDEFHHVLLSWPVELEATLPAAVHTSSVRRYGDGAKLAPARGLRRVLKQAGFQSVRRDTFPIERAAPFDPPTTAFLTHHLKFLRSVAYPHLTPALQAVFDRAADPTAPESLYRMPESELVCLNAVYFARPVSHPPRGRRPVAPTATPVS